MLRNPLRILVVLVSLAVAAELVAVVGWWQWSTVREATAADPSTGARMLASGRGLALPSGVAWSRRLTASDLRGADLDAAQAAFQAVGEAQRRWLPTDPEGFKNLSRAAFLSGDLEGAVDRLGEAVAREPTSAYLQRLMALMLRRAGRNEECLEHLTEAVALSSSVGRPALELTPEEKQSVELGALRRRIELYPRDQAAGRLELARRLQGLGRDEEADQVLEPVAGQPDVELWRAERDLRRGQPQAALERVGYLGASSLYPDLVRVRALSVVARARDAMGDADGALAAANAAVELRSGSAAPYAALATIAERRGDLETALEHLRRARGVEPTDVALLLRFARLAERVGERSETRATLERAVELAPDRPEIAARLVDFLLRSGQLVDATLRLSRFLERFPEDPELLKLAQRLRQEVAGPGSGG